MSKRIGIVTGIPLEAEILAGLTGRLAPPLRPLVRCAGMNTERAAALAADLVAEGVAGLMSFGVAGGLMPGLIPGALVLPETVSSMAGPRLVCDNSWLSAAFKLFAPQSVGLLVTVTAPVALAADKAALYRRSGAVAVDMESYVVADFARSAGVPFIAVRAIVDPAELDLPSVALAGGRAAAMRKLARRPQELPALLRLARHMARAKKTLSRVGRDGLPLFGL